MTCRTRGFVICALALLALSCGPRGAVKAAGQAAPADAATDAPPADTAEAAAWSGPKVEVVFHLMSKCPFGAQVQKAIKPVLDKLGGAVAYTQEFIGEGSAEEGFESLHGTPEVVGDIAQLCAASLFPQGNAYMALVDCMARDFHAIPGNWEPCAAEAGLDASLLRGCIEGPDGAGLFADSIARSAAKGAKGSPTITIGGVPYKGGREPGDFEHAICCAFAPSAMPAACDLGGESCPVPFTVRVIGDARYAESAELVKQLSWAITANCPKAAVALLDYGDPQGKKLFEESGADLLPVALFPPEAKNDPGFDYLSSFTTEVGGLFVFSAKAGFDPTRELCENGVDDTGDGLADCADEDCRGALGCREEKKGALDVFVMSRCPFAVKVEYKLKEVRAHFKGKLKLGLHFIVETMTKEKFDKLPENDRMRDWCVQKSDGVYYCSVHGPDEVDEDIVQACAVKLSGKSGKWLDFIECRNGYGASGDWKPCAKEAKLGVAKLEACVKGTQGLALIAADAALAEALGFTGSPTFLVNNNSVAPVKDRSVAGIVAAVCERNKDLAACKELPEEEEGGAKDYPVTFGDGCGGQ